MRLHRTLSLLPLTVFVILLTSLAHADFQTGQDAHNRGDYATALIEWRSLAERGDAEAQYNLGVLYDQGHGVPQDYTQARAWWLKAAEQGDAAAQYNLGLLYNKGQGVPQDYSQARDWWLRAAAQGYAPAQVDFGVLYNKGHGGPRDDLAARDWFLKAAEQGDADAKVKLGFLYHHRGVLQDAVQAHMWMNLAGAQGHVGGVTQRDAVAKKMTSEQLIEAQRLARDWWAQHQK